MVPIHKRQSLNFQVLIWMICTGLFNIAYAAKPAEKTEDTAAKVTAIIEKAAKKEDFSRELNEITQKEKEAAIPTLISVFQDTSRSWQERWFSAIALSKFPNDQTKEVLMKGTKDPLSIIRSVSIQALSEFEADDKSLEVIQKSLKDSSLMVRISVVKALAKLKDRSSVDALAKELFADHNYYRGEPMFGIRENIVTALGEIESMKGVDPLMKVIQKEPNTKIGSLACDSMEKIVHVKIDNSTYSAVRDCPEYWLNWYKEQAAQDKSKSTKS